MYIVYYCHFFVYDMYLSVCSSGWVLSLIFCGHYLLSYLTVIVQQLSRKFGYTAVFTTTNHLTLFYKDMLSKWNV